MFKTGNVVYIKDSAREDITSIAWQYILAHRTATVLCVFDNTGRPVPETDTLYVVVWREPFPGGWNCWNNCLPGFGQIITHKNLDLCFEASYEAVTVPNISPPDAAEDYGEHL